jgi:uncharacterized peroxidase-related enzyme
MSFIQTPAPAGAPNYERAFSLRPDVYAAWQGLVGAIKADMDPRRFELASVAAARRLRCSYCLLAHGNILAEQHLDGETVRALAGDHHAAGLDALDVAVMDVADKVAEDATAVTEADLDRLRELGLSDAEVLDVILAASVRCFFAKVLDATGTLADQRFAGLDPALRDALTVGRPIAEA